MTLVGLSSEESPTSAAGPVVQRGHAIEIILVAGALFTPGTSAALPVPPQRPIQTVAQTNTGLSARTRATTSSMLFELRRLTGLTWEQLSRVLGLSRRSLHFWASGKPMASANEERLGKTLATVRRIDRGSASQNRSALLTPLANGTQPLDLLAAGRNDEVVALLQPGAAQRPELTPLSASAREARKPRPPAELVGALQDTAPREGGRGRPVRVGKAKRR